MPDDTELPKLLARCRLTLDAIERVEPSPTWPQVRAIVEESAGRLDDLRTLEQELRTFAAGLPEAARADLARQLRAHGADDAPGSGASADAAS